MKQLITTFLIIFSAIFFAHSQCTNFFADFSSNGPKCTGETVDFVNIGSSYPGLTFFWDFGAGATPPSSILENPTGIVYSTSGLKLVTLNITDSALVCLASASHGVSINQEPVVSFTSNTPQCNDLGVNFTNTGSTGAMWSYSWDFGVDAFPPGANSENPGGITYFTSGNKTVTFTISDANCSATTTDVLTINQSPDANFTSTAPQCTDAAVDFTNTGTSGASYSWSFGSGAVPATSLVENPTGIIYSTAGTKTITLITTLGPCSDTSTQTININLTPTVGFTSTAPQCAGEPVDFTNTGTNGLGWAFSWDFGNDALPAGSTTENPVGVVYATGGTKTVVLTISDANCSADFTNTITINTKPVADFAFTSPHCTGDPVTFINTGTSGATTYAWNFGSGASPATSSLENPAAVVYSTASTKLVTLITTLGACSDTSIQTLNINLTPTVGFTSTAPQCAGEPVDFTNTGTNGLGWAFDWDFGDDALPAGSTTEDPVGVVYATGGTKTVVFTISDANCSADFTNTITINTKPVADFAFTSPHCTGDPVTFINTGTSGASYAWNFGSGASPATSSLENPTGIVYSTASTKLITLITTIGGCTDTSIQTLNINLTPTVSFTSTAPQCAGEPVDFTNTGTNGLGWAFNWDLGDDALPAGSTTENPVGVVYATGGSKTVVLTISDANCSADFTNTITINTKPVADFAFTAPHCTDDTVTFINTGTSGATAYAWDFGSGASPVGAVVENPGGVVYSTAGTKLITLITSLGNCSDTSIQILNIKLTPTVGFTSTAPQCAGEPVDFANTGTNGLGWAFNWDLGDDALPAGSTTENPVGVVYSSGGTKTVVLTISDADCSADFTDTITINTKPVAGFASTAPQCTGDTVYFINTGTSGANYAWTFGSGASSDTSSLAFPPGIVYSTASTKLATLITSLGSCSDTAFKAFNINLTPTINFSSTAPQCAGQLVDFTNTGSTGADWAFSWDLGAGATPATSAAESPIGVNYIYGGTKTVTLTISDAFCNNTDSAVIFINPIPVVDAGEDSTICANRCTQIGSAAITGNTYSWFPTATLDDPSLAIPVACPTAPVTQYVVTVTNTANGCRSIDSVIVSMLPPVSVDAGIDVEICIGDTIQIGASLVEGQTYSWSPTYGLSNPSSPNPLAFPDSTIVYTLTAEYFGCESISDDVVVSINPLPLANVTDILGREEVTIALGDFVQLIGTGGIQYEWTPIESLDNPGVYNPIATPDTTTTYTVIVTDLKNCVNSDSILIIVLIPNIYIPNAFTPNGDGHNDVFYIRNQGLVAFDFQIFNKWGELIYKTSTPTDGWNGNQAGNGKELPQGAYVYFVKGKLSDGEEFVEKGIVNLIR